MSTALSLKLDTLRTLPTDAARQIQCCFADRYDLQMLVQSARSVARGPVARLVAQGGRNAHEWTAGKAELLEAFDRSGITAVFMDPEHGGFLVGPRNLALALVAFELAWVDGGAATASLAGCLALAPIHERGTPEQRDRYMKLAAPCPAWGRPQTVARRVLSRRAHTLCRGRYRHAGREDPHREIEGRPGADFATGEARPLHHQHWICQFRYGGGGLG
jgi:alkylation response protein AidB-like acyl-CoA dehydrogenase